MSHSLFKLLFVACQIFATLTSRKLRVDGSVAQFPPKGWNSYDSFTWTISEEDFLKNAKLVAELLLPFGYEYVVVDMLWYRKHEPGVTFTTAGHDVIDNWGRPIPDPTRWPSSQGGKGFGPVAELIHSMGLKFGIHVVRGISTAAVESNTPIFGAQGSPPGPDLRNWTAGDIALLDEKCSFMPDCFVGVNVSSEGGQAFIKSLYQQYADWGVDFVKHDCVFGNDLRLDEIQTVSQAITGTGRPIVYSLAPGNQASPVEAIAVANLTHMYRVTPDVWDSWNDLQLQFDVARDYATAGLIGGPGLDGGRSWPDLDMLPLGWIADPGATSGPYHQSRLSLDEQRSLVTLRAMAKSPLLFGGDMRHIDEQTIDLLTNPTVLDINSFSLKNTEIPQLDLSLNSVKLTTCKAINESYWSLQKGASEQICWKQHLDTKHKCLNWKALNSTDPLRWMNISLKEDISSIGQIHTDALTEHCLDASTIGQSMAKPLKNSFSLCSKHVGQAWKLTSTGHLVDAHFGRCAVLINNQDRSIRIWVARGQSGQSYVAFFNNSGRKKKISIELNHIMKGLYGGFSNENATQVLNATNTLHNQTYWRCTGTEIWSSKNIGVAWKTLSETLRPHSCALYMLSCSPLVEPIKSSLLSKVLLACFIVLVFSLTSIAGLRWCYISRKKKH